MGMACARSSHRYSAWGLLRYDKADVHTPAISCHCGRALYSFVRCRRTNCSTWPLTVHARQFRCDYPPTQAGGLGTPSRLAYYPTASSFHQNNYQEAPTLEAQSLAWAWIFPKCTNLCDYSAWELRTFPWECVRKMPVSVRVCSSDFYARRG
ncbi:hypothetical protein EI94DRAFT_869325 [Lactarius quietus]|nr:hypothetical protein EI94DRAFT_869325 [Lactarius quietus]